MNIVQGLFDRTLIGVRISQMGFRLWAVAFQNAYHWSLAYTIYEGNCLYFVTDNEPQVDL